MSWKCGNQPAPVSVESIARALAIAASLWSRFACVTTTPFGSLLEPEVYCRNATVSPRRSGIRQLSGSASGSPSVATQGIRSESPASRSHAVRGSTIADVVSTSPMPASSNITADRCIERSSVGRGAGTAITPA